MKIRPRNIPKFQEGSKFNLSNWIQQNPEYYKWYSSAHNIRSYLNILITL